MRNFVKYAAIGTACYLIGYYKARYNSLRSMVEAYEEICEEAKKED